MSQPPSPGTRQSSRWDQPVRYEIRLQEHLGTRWSAWFDGLVLTTDADGTTLVAGPVADQAALHGLLQKVRDTGLPLLSVTPALPHDPPRPSAHPARSTP